MRAHGLLLLDKPAELGSQQAMRHVKRILGIEKKNRSGHIGTLDPLATGILPLVFGDATRFAFGLERVDKRYITTIQFGAESSTDDARGELIPQRSLLAKELSLSRIENLIFPYIGEIDQVPPNYSAVRIDGQRMYKVMRTIRCGESTQDNNVSKDTKGTNLPIAINIPPRKVKIHEINLLNIDADNQRIEVEISCSSGTYIRSLARDWGGELGSGAFVLSLRRIGFGRFSVADALSCKTIVEAASRAGNEENKLMRLMYPPDSLVLDLPAQGISPAQAQDLYSGRQITVTRKQDNVIPGQKNLAASLYRLYISGSKEEAGDDQEENQFIGIGEIVDDLSEAPVEEGASIFIKVKRLLPTQSLEQAI